MDFPGDLNPGDLLRLKTLDAFRLDYSLHHRSGIFGTSSLFGRNYNKISLQYHF
ncbi:MAG: hypothetical protein RQ753_04960 [Desulfurivibrionaceae bacterium]|nr:hypothetical protein [Desulfobulbales bacterium]MDT8335024.1 hypothetical protein [Desulfurivibrionaceae bacterium]